MSSIILLNEQGMIVGASGGSLTLLGYKQDELYDKNIRDIFHPCHTKEKIFDFHNHLDYEVKCKVRNNDSDQREVVLSISTYHSSSNSSAHYAATLQIFNASTHFQQAWINGYNQFLKSEESALLGHWSLDLATETVHWSPGIYAIFGLDKNKKPPTLDEHKQYILPEKWDHFINTIKGCAKNQKSYQLITHIRNHHNEHKILQSYGEPQLDDNGKLVGFFGICIDITKGEQDKKELQLSQQRFQLAIESSQDSIWDWDIAAGTWHHSSSLPKMLGYSDQDEINLQEYWDSFVHPDDIASVHEKHAQHRKNKKPYANEYRIQMKSGNYLWIEVRADSIWDENGNQTRTIGSIRNINERKILEQQIVKQQQKLQFLFDNTPVMMSTKDADGKITSLNKTAANTLHGTPEDFIGKDDYELYPDMADKYRADDLDVMQSGKPKLNIIEKNVPKNSPSRWVTVNKLPFTDPITGKDGIFVVASDITELKHKTEQLHKLANYDSLTALPNRSSFLESLSQSIQTTMRKSEKFALLFIDLDNFKYVNDMLGHTMGDKLLKTVGTVLKSKARHTDVVARLGGDEFGIILNNMGSDINSIVERYCNIFNTSFEIDNVDIHSKASIGVAVFPNAGTNPETLLQHADIAMYVAKNNGGSSFAFYDAALHKMNKRKYKIRKLLPEALNNGEMSVVYQPQISLSTNKVLGIEALVRWNSSTLGMVPPHEFIPIAEESRHILALGKWITNTALSDFGRILNAGNANDLKLSLNLSMVQLTEKTFISDLLSLIQIHSVATHRIIFELTETALMQYPKQMQSTLIKIASTGAQLSLDDFGVGYSSLSFIYDLPISAIKIDKGFIKNIANKSDSAALVTGIIAFANSLNLDVVAEGIENAEQADFLKQQGCHKAQGFYYSPPLSFDQLLALFEESSLATTA